MLGRMSECCRRLILLIAPFAMAGLILFCWVDKLCHFVSNGIRAFGIENRLVQLQLFTLLD